MESTSIVTPDGLTLAAAHHHADGTSRGTVLLAHGITQDMDEGGMFVRLADCLTDSGFDVVRFSFRGHGDSDGTPAGTTIAGERLDFESAFDHVRSGFDGPYFVVAKSFGAVSTCLSLDRFEADLAGVVLWNPVLDVEGTFLDPHLPWGTRNFTGENLASLDERGFLRIDGGFEMGGVLYDELGRYDPAARFRERSVPALVIHGDADEVVPYGTTRRIAEEADAEFHAVENGNHGFVRPGRGTVGPGEAREHDRRTVEWLRSRSEN